MGVNTHSFRMSLRKPKVFEQMSVCSLTPDHSERALKENERLLYTKYTYHSDMR
jgi:hypothetical protein